MQKRKINYQTAEESAKKHLKEIEQLMKMIDGQLEKYRSMTAFDYADAGTLGEIENQLAETWEFVAEAD